MPAAADYVNAQILGGSGQVMIGNIIETLYITNSQYPQVSYELILLAAADRHLPLRPGAGHPRRARRERGVISR